VNEIQDCHTNKSKESKNIMDVIPDRSAVLFPDDKDESKVDMHVGAVNCPHGYRLDHESGAQIITKVGQQA
jgi:hypothetical protein